MLLSFSFYFKCFTANTLYVNTQTHVLRMVQKIHASKMHVYTLPAKPDKPSIDEQLQIIEGQKVKYTCTGNVGNPPGYIEFLVRKHGEENFNVSSIVSTSSAVTPNDKCNNEQSFYHEHFITSDWNRTTIKCRAVNQRTITENDDMNLYISDEEDIISIPGLLTTHCWRFIC